MIALRIFLSTVLDSRRCFEVRTACAKEHLGSLIPWGIVLIHYNKIILALNIYQLIPAVLELLTRGDQKLLQLNVDAADQGKPLQHMKKPPAPGQFTDIAIKS